MVSGSIMTSGLMVGPTATAGSGGSGGSVLGLALIGVGAFDGRWVRGLLEELFSHDPNLLGRQLVHRLSAFTQAQRLHEPDLLHNAIAAKYFTQL